MSNGAVVLILTASLGLIACTEPRGFQKKDASEGVDMVDSSNPRATDGSMSNGGFGADSSAGVGGAGGGHDGAADVGRADVATRDLAVDAPGDSPAGNMPETPRTDGPVSGPDAPICSGATDGTRCGADMVCRGGLCVSCVAGQPCQPSGNACKNGATSCDSGSSVCVETTNKAPSTPCGAAQSCTNGVKTTATVCNGSGTCVPGTTMSCAPLACNGTDCATSCPSGTCGPQCQSCASSSFCDSNPNHCGACGHSCLGGTCGRGKCQPLQIHAGAIGSLLVSDANYIYFIKPKNGINLLARLRDDGSDYREMTSVDIGVSFFRLAIANGAVYWIAGDEIRSCPTPDCSGGMRSEGSAMDPSGLFSDRSGTRVFWSAKDGNGVQHVWTSPSNPTRVVAANINAEAADDQFLYYSVGQEAYRVPIGGGTPSHLGSATGSFALSSTHLFFVSEGDPSVSNYLAAFRMPLSGGSRQLVGYRRRPVSFGTSIVVDGANVYWYYSGDELNILSCSTSGGCGENPEQVVVGTFYGNFDSGMVVRSNSIIFGTDRGIYRVAK